MKKIWIDLTDISVWTGHHTGTQRLVYQIAQRFRDLPNVEYFIFNPIRNTFHSYSIDDVIAKIKAAEQQTGAAASAPKQPLIKHLAARAYYNAPPAIRRHLTPSRRELLKKVYKKTRQLMRRGKAHVIVPNTPEVYFSQDDIVLIMGKPWDYPSFIETLRTEKLKHNFKLVQVIYDLIPIFFPHLFGEPLFLPYTQYMFETVAISDYLLAISKSTKHDVATFAQDMLLQPPRTQVIRLGDDFSTIEPVKPNIAVQTGDYILCVGTVEVRKNHQLLYNAYKLGLSQGEALPKLVIVGGKGWYTNDLLYELSHDPAMRNLVFVLHHTNDKELKWLYENCLFTVYPSVYEGWGLPIAESLAYGKMCIAAHTSSMPEIAGELIDYFSPYDSLECLKTIRRYMNPSVLAKKEAEIKRQYKPTSWDETYTQIVQILEPIRK